MATSAGFFFRKTLYIELVIVDWCWVPELANEHIEDEEDLDVEDDLDVDVEHDSDLDVDDEHDPDLDEDDEHDPDLELQDSHELDRHRRGDWRLLLLNHKAYIERECRYDH